MSKISKIAWEEDETGGWKKRNKMWENLWANILLETNISPEKSILKMIFLFPR